MNLYSQKIIDADARAISDCAPYFEKIEAIKRENCMKVQAAFAKNRVALADFAGSTGYGFGDAGRDKLDRLFADIVGAPDALCRAHFLSGTHAITVALFAVLRPGDTLLYAVGEPYDTLKTVISSKGTGSLADFGVKFVCCPLKDNRPDLRGIAEMSKTANVVMIQRSRGYSDRDALTIDEIAEIAAAARSANPDIIVMADNCYGEFCETREPCAAGVELMAGSLIKNPGGAIACCGGYVAGSERLVELCANRLTAPGTGRELGCVPGGHRETYLGLYLAPAVTAEALKTSVYASRLFELLGARVTPSYSAPRSDIVTVLRLGNRERLCAFCAAIQGGSPVDSFAVPEPWEMPGYGCEVVMAAGAFTNGSSIELSCDAPLREPYDVYLQGGIVFDYARAAVMSAAHSVFGAEN